MLDFIKIRIMSKTRTNSVDVYPEFLVKPSKDLMIRGRQFYAIWDEENKVWSRDESDAQRLIDEMTYKYAEENKDKFDSLHLKLMQDFSSNVWNTWQKYCKSLPDRFHELDSKIIFADEEVKKTDYASKSLNYSMKDEDISAYEEIISTLYDPSERQKLEWAIGSIISGDSKWIQKFIVLYGAPGSGKSTILNIIQMLFNGYYTSFDSKSLASRNSDFALEPFKNNPLIAIEHEGKLSKIEDNTRLNSIVSHEELVVNAKFERLYSSKFRTFLLMCTNEPVKITDAKSGLLRRLIDVSPSGRLIPQKRYDELMDKVRFELGGIAKHCYDIYKELGPKYYNSYVPVSMISKTNDFYNFMEENYKYFSEHEVIEINPSWKRYNEYCDDARVTYPFNKRVFKDEMKNYFESWDDLKGEYYGFKVEKFNLYSDETNGSSNIRNNSTQNNIGDSWLKFNKRKSLFDDIFGLCPAQYANEEGNPLYKWDNVKTTVDNIDTKKLHYVRVPNQLIVIDFDLKNEKGEKDYILNLEAASKWPETYAELSKSGCGIHLHYIYEGNVSELSRVYDDNIEIKVFSGKSALRRQLTKCNDISIAHISSGLPIKKGGKRLITNEGIESERHLRNLIKKGLRKEVFPNTKPSVDYICKILDDAYEQGLHYDVMDMAPAIQAFANNSTHKAVECLKIVSKMKFKSEEPSDNVDDYGDMPIVIFDVESAPNHFLICWKKAGDDCKVVKMLDPKPKDVEKISKFRLAGFNNRRYDNHMCYGSMMGYNPEQLFKLSQRIVVDHDPDAFFNEAYNFSYTDVYDFLSSQNKKGLKKLEIELDIHHKEWDLPWDEPIPDDRLDEWMEYCANDVLATEVVWNAYQSDWEAREMLAELSGLTVNDTTNQCTTKFIVGNDRNPQSSYIYTDLSTIFPGYRFDARGIDKSEYNDGTKIVSGKSIYHGKDPGEGGYAVGYPGMYTKVALLDVESMHPHSLIALNMFGDIYTSKFAEIVKARLAIKHGEYDVASKMLDGKLKPYLKNKKDAKKVANALKTAINSVYGLTSASFPNKLRDDRNVDNIVAKYGALFMINLEEEVTKRGGKVVHIKTDSIKIADATPDIIKFCMEYAKKYGFTFNHESTYDKMCIVNDAVYIAKYATKEWCQNQYGYIPEDNEELEGKWTPTGKQFQIPYVFKTLFSHEKIEFKDLCEVFSVSTALYLKFGEDMRFVGRIGEFCPIKEGKGGGELLRDSNNGKFSAVQGTKKPGKIKKGEAETYFWLESENVKLLNKEDDIDLDYYRHLVDEAVETISKYGDFEWFVSDSSEDFGLYMNVPTGEPEELPWD